MSYGTVSVRLQPFIFKIRSRAAMPPETLLAGSFRSCARMAAMGPEQAGMGGRPPEALPWPRTMPARAQPIRFDSHEPLLKPAMNTWPLSTQKFDSTSLSAASKNAISGESAEPVEKQDPTALKPTRMALFVDAF